MSHCSARVVLASVTLALVVAVVIWRPGSDPERTQALESAGAGGASCSKVGDLVSGENFMEGVGLAGSIIDSEGSTFWLQGLDDGLVDEFNLDAEADVIEGESVTRRTPADGIDQVLVADGAAPWILSSSSTPVSGPAFAAAKVVRAGGRPEGWRFVPASAAAEGAVVAPVSQGPGAVPQDVTAARLDCGGGEVDALVTRGDASGPSSLLVDARPIVGVPEGWSGQAIVDGGERVGAVLLPVGADRSMTLVLRSDDLDLVGLADDPRAVRTVAGLLGVAS